MVLRFWEGREAKIGEGCARMSKTTESKATESNIGAEMDGSAMKQRVFPRIQFIIEHPPGKSVTVCQGTMG